MKKYMEYAVEKAVELLGIDSPTGYTAEAADAVQKSFADLGFEAKKTVKGSVMIDLGGKNADDALLLEVHLDTLGGMVTEIKSNGRLRITNIGGLNGQSAETENCRIVTKFDGIYEGTCQICNASTHVNGDFATASRKITDMEVLLDEIVSSVDDVKALGISAGDFVCFDPRTRVTEKGYIKSRFLDDKLSVGIVYGYAKYLAEEKIVPERKVYIHVTTFEEVGHGGSAAVPAGVTEAISIDMGCVGDGLQCDERMVSICAKDSGGPYHYDVVKGLIEAAKREGAEYAVDIYPYYGSDVECTLRAGYDVRHGLIGPGVYASHGYERSHKDGVLNTLKLLKGYIKSRFLDDKLSVGIVYGYAKYLAEEKIVPERKVYIHVTTFEEVGHGGSAAVPAGVTEAISIDMGCVGDGLQCDERMVSICAKDSGGPYHYDVVKGLIEAAKREGAEYAVDIYPYYGSDVECTLRAGYDVRHGLIGPGVYASHGYERSHKDGVLNTLKLLKGYIG